MIEDIGAAHLALLVAAALTFVGLGVAWLSVPRVDGAPRVAPRVLMVLGVMALLVYGLDVRGLLGIGVVVVAKLACSDEAPLSRAFRPRILGIAVAGAVTGVAVSAALAGTLPLVDRFEQTQYVGAIVFGAVGALGVLAISDWERVRLRERVQDARNAELQALAAQAAADRPAEQVPYEAAGGELDVPVVEDETMVQPVYVEAPAADLAATDDRTAVLRAVDDRTVIEPVPSALSESAGDETRVLDRVEDDPVSDGPVNDDTVSDGPGNDDTVPAQSRDGADRQRVSR